MKTPAQQCALLRVEALASFCTPDQCQSCGWNEQEDKRRRALIDGGRGLHISRRGRRYLDLTAPKQTPQEGR